jgi:hypothetical protein
MIMIIQSGLRREREKKVSTERNEYKSHSKEMDKAGFIGFLVHRKKDPRRGKSSRRARDSCAFQVHRSQNKRKFE